ncbi:arginase-1 [Bactrocera dorsalis]|uniref:Arginase n=1 Tax=Bactrocera dorsalis TaxID=27457 RepID=A0ABM3JMC1_BACDO|nr:arginase-1 [Bactrocera dorsalis]
MLKRCATLVTCQLQQPRCRYSSGASNAEGDAKARLGIIGVPFSKGQGKGGVEKAPALLREHGLVPLLEQVSCGQLEVHDYGDLQFGVDPIPTEAPEYSKIKNYGEFMGCNKALIRKVQQLLQENDQFLTIGGDHAIGFGSVAGHLQHTPNLSLVWVDAHADINLHNTSESGNIHGMPVSFLLKELRVFWQHAKLEQTAPVCLAADQLVYIGLRDIDPYEAYILNKLGIRAFAMDSVDKYGISKIIERTLDSLKPQNKIHVSFDIDALDKAVAPSTGTAVCAGLTLREGISVVEALRDTNRVQGIDLVELNPSLGNEQDVNTTIASSLEILKSICGYKRSGNFANIKMDLFETVKN